MRGVGRSVECDARMMPRGDVMTCRLQKQAQVHRPFVIGLHSAFLRQSIEGRTMAPARSEEHTSELQLLMRISYAVFCLKKKTDNNTNHNRQDNQTKHRT